MNGDSLAFSFGLALAIFAVCVVAAIRLDSHEDRIDAIETRIATVESR